MVVGGRLLVVGGRLLVVGGRLLVVGGRLGRRWLERRLLAEYWWGSNIT